MSLFSSSKESSGSSRPGFFIPGLTPDIKSAIQAKILGPAGDFGALTKRAIQQAIAATRGGYGARGLAGSGIAQRGEEQIASDLALQGAAQESQILNTLIAAGVRDFSKQKGGKSGGLLGGIF